MSDIKPAQSDHENSKTDPEKVPQSQQADASPEDANSSEVDKISDKKPDGLNDKTQLSPPVPAGPEPGPVSEWLREQGLQNTPLERDHIGVEMVRVEPLSLLMIASALKGQGFDHLQCQGGYDEGPGLQLVCFYHMVAMGEWTEQVLVNPSQNVLREVRLKVFLPREGTPSLPSLYGLFRGADWQERETFDMFGINFDGHPHPKRLLMPEDWKGWPLRKDYVQPDFYEMQDAY